jgi:pyruvate dehydrogenase E1 component
LKLEHLATLFPSDERHAPIVTVQDGASHGLSFLGSVYGAPTVPLGVDTWGQSGSRAALYEYAGINPEEIVNAAMLALELNEE